MLDKVQVLKALRATLLEAEIVIVTATGEYVGIRDGEYDPLAYTRPDDPDKRPVIASDDFGVFEYPMDPNGKALFIREDFLPAFEDATANDQSELAGIYQLTILVPSADGARADLETALDRVKYVQEIYDPAKSNLAIAQTDNKGIILDQSSFTAPAKDGEWLAFPVGIGWRTYNQT